MVNKKYELIISIKTEKSLIMYNLINSKEQTLGNMHPQYNKWNKSRKLDFTLRKLK